jgi:hypothetical protein
MVSAVLTRLPELDWASAARLANVNERLGKYNQNESRDWRGRWTGDRSDPAVWGLNPLGSSGSDTDIGAAGPDTPPPSQSEYEDYNSLADDGFDPAFKSKYDELGPVEFAKAVIAFGDQLARMGQSLTPAESEEALKEYSFLQDRLSLWIAYDYKPPGSQANLIAAAQSLYEGAVNSGIVAVGGKGGDLPQSMVVVASGAVFLDNSQAGSRIRPEPGRILDADEPFADEIRPGQPGEIGDIIDNEKAKIVWGRGIEGQGLPWQRFNARMDPKTRELPANSKVFDRFNDASGEAVSDKTLDTLCMGYIQKPDEIFRKMKGYIDETADYAPRTRLEPLPSAISSRTIQLAVPEYTSPVQWRYLERAVRYGSDRGVSVIITRVRG